MLKEAAVYGPLKFRQIDLSDLDRSIMRRPATKKDMRVFLNALHRYMVIGEINHCK